MGVLGSSVTASNLILGMFLKTLRFFPPVLNSHSEVTFTSLIGLQPKKKIEITNWKPCASASSTLHFNCFKAEAMCCVLSGVRGKVKRKWVKKKNTYKKSTLRGKWNRTAPGLEQPEDQQHEDNSQGQSFLLRAFPASTSFQLVLPEHRAPVLADNTSLERVWSLMGWTSPHQKTLHRG